MAEGMSHEMSGSYQDELRSLQKQVKELQWQNEELRIQNEISLLEKELGYLNVKSHDSEDALQYPQGLKLKSSTPYDTKRKMDIPTDQRMCGQEQKVSTKFQLYSDKGRSVESNYETSEAESNVWDRHVTHRNRKMKDKIRTNDGTRHKLLETKPEPMRFKQSVAMKPANMMEQVLGWIIKRISKHVQK